MKNQLIRSTLTLSLSAALAACGGGGGGGGSGSSSGSAAPASGASTPTSAQTSSSANVATPQYASSSFQSAVFTQLNAYRNQCGANALTENTTLDAAAQSHSAYMAANSTVDDNEKQGATGFTGVTYADRNVAKGYPANIGTLGDSDTYYTVPALTEQGYGQAVVAAWLGGVYHSQIAVAPYQNVGIGESETTYNGAPQIWADITLTSPQTTTSTALVTFPCQGVTGVPFSDAGEIPAPPNTGAAWGTPVAIAGRVGDAIVLQSASMTGGTSGSPITLNVLDSTKDTTGFFTSNEAVVYPSSPLQPNMTYTVTINGTDNGTPFTRTFSFTTGSSAA